MTTTNSPMHSPFPIPGREVHWKPELETVEQLLEFHMKKISELSPERKVQGSSEENYIQEIKLEIQKDYQVLEQLGILRFRGKENYGLTLKGAFQMMYRQWKSLQANG